MLHIKCSTVFQNLKVYGILGITYMRNMDSFVTNKIDPCIPEPEVNNPSDNLNNVASIAESSTTKATKSYSKRALKRKNRALEKKVVVKKCKTTETSGFTSDLFTDTDYYFENGLRKVYPYYFSFTSYAKGRWVGRDLLDVYNSEFRGDKEDHEAAMEAGSISVNGQVKSAHYVVKESDHIAHTLHRHENPVCDQPIEILHIDDDIVVINKPSSIPCHPCGKYRFNSILFILGKELGLDQLRNIYRLDRLTSGVLIMGRRHLITKQLESDVADRLVEKEYVCRVTGDFPDGKTTVDQPLRCISHKLCLFRVDPAGKPSRTTFEKVHFNGRSSIVTCRPHTGRTHQIRVHLQFLGHPIVNDPLYNTDAWGPNRCKGGVLDKSLDELEAAIRAEHHVGRFIEPDDAQVHHVGPTVTADSTDGTTTTSHSRLTGDCDVTEDKCVVGEVTRVTPRDPDVTRGSRYFGNILTHSDDVAKYLNRSTENLCTHTVTGSGGHTTFYFKKRPNRNSTVDITNAGHETIVQDRGMDLVNIEESKDSTSNWHRFDPDKVEVDKNCSMCRRVYINPKPGDLVMYLHAVRYQGPGWDYSTSIPEWGQADWTLD